MNDRVDEPLEGAVDDREERTILEALAALERGGPGAAGGAASAAGGVVDEEARAYIELFGALPRGLEPVAPSAGARERLLSAVRTGAAGGAAAAGPLPFRRPEADSGGPAGARPARSAGRSAPRWALPLAAALAALAFGLAGWLGLRVAEQESTIAELTRELSAAGEQSASLERANADLALLRDELSRRLALATSVGMVACPLKPMDDEHPEAQGLLFMSPDGGPWLVSVHDLEPPPEGSSYVLWFLGRDRPHRVGVLAPGPDRAVQISAETMPGHETMTGVAVTLEKTPQAERPSGPMLLYGEERIAII